MRKINSIILNIAFAVGLLSCNTNNTPTAISPDGKLKLEFEKTEQGEFIYSFSANGNQFIDKSAIGFQLTDSTTIPSANWTIEQVSKSSVKKEWKPIWGKRQVVPDCYNQTIVTLKGNGKTAINTMQIEARAYDDGVAFRYLIPQEEGDTLKIEAELTTYNFGGDYTAWYYNFEYHNLGPEKLTESDGQRLPVMTIQVDSANYMAIHEADLQTGEPLMLETKRGERSFRVTSKPLNIYPGYTSAWHVIMYGTTPGEMVDSHLIELLNPEPAAEYDFSWVKPGVALWDWRANGAIWDGFTYTMSYPSWVRMIDFASENGISYLVLDANWYGPEFETESDPTEGDKAKDVQKIIKYGKDKGVGVWLYLNDVAGQKYPIEETLKQYGDWGAAGVKYGFMKGTWDQKNQWTQKVTKLCADNKLLVDFHDEPVHPYGQMRTWPNAITREFCQAQLDAHRVFEPKTLVTSVFVNMIAGPLDMNNGMFDLRQGNTTRVDENQPVPSTVVSEAARTLIVFSGATILPDIPEYYKKHPVLLEFIAAQKMPWVESKTLAGEIGEYIIMMRQTDEAYLVAAATNELARDLEITLDFLPEGEFNVSVIEDGEGAHYLTNRETLRLSEKKVTKNDKIQVHLAPGGGACLTFKK